MHARGDGVVSRQIAGQEDGAIDLIERCEVGEHSKCRRAGLSKQVGEIRAA